MTRKQRRDARLLKLKDFSQGAGVYLAAIVGVICRRFVYIYRTTGSLDTFLTDWPEMVIAVIAGISVSVAFDAGGMTPAVRRKNWGRRLGRSFIAGLAGDGLAGDIF